MSEVKSSPSIITSSVMRSASEEYKQRRRTQMIRFYAASFATLIVSRVVFRGIQGRKYVPNLFNPNHMQPEYSKRQEAIAAIGYASGLATTSFSMFVFGAAWVWDITTVKDFGKRMKEYLGGADNQKKLVSIKTDEETLKIQEGLSSLIDAKK